jgi:hypothetical protein
LSTLPGSLSTFLACAHMCDDVDQMLRCAAIDEVERQ